ncbi:hypothetical protein FNH22_08920 [Fulvivirga sp. M361]|uniref:alginate lyase family protein n=1 Tax=Fulvivirga sp. M361 TaxID=2594266 RepID=UPI001179B09D|nr:alginate lyase family protein [Fulvivirga sp. M361]TRX60159.1 hypothetical protein FNH22_08920 [Fulvivirga sp. M361]
MRRHTQIHRSLTVTTVLLVALLAITLLSTCHTTNGTIDHKKVLKELSDHYHFLQDRDSAFFPRSPEKPDVRIEDWTSGFLPGILWYLASQNDSELWRETAHRFTMPLEGLKTYRRTHDLGFMLYNSFGNGYKLTGDSTYRAVLIEGAYSLASRYDNTIEAIKSWDWGAKEDWQYPVIIDNMMNLEYLFWAAKATHDTAFYEMAYRHAKTTLKNHFREDHSSYHVVDYDTTTGAPRWKGTFQGMADHTAWARGQAWGLYGFTVAFRETGDSTFLEKAHQIADFVLDHSNLPEDKVPYWDFDDEASKDTPRDVSAAVIITSALLELQAYSNTEKSDEYKLTAREILTTVNNNYRDKNESNRSFFLDHSTGHKPRNSEIDMPLIYAEYYFAEALVRLIKLDIYREPDFISEIHTKTLSFDLLPEIYSDIRDALNRGPFSVLQKDFMPPGADKNDYMSMGIYWWPDEAKEDGLPYIRKDGQINPEVYKITDWQYMMKTVAYAFDCALAYQNTADDRFALKASELLKSWFTNDSTKMNPHLNYGQGVPGRHKGRRYGIIETRDLWQAYQAADLIQNSGHWGDEDHDQLKAWFNDFLDWLLTSELGKLESQTRNNHHSWYNAQVGHLALICERELVLTNIIEDTKLNVLNSQLEKGGGQPEELSRTLSFSYSTMNLMACFHLALLAEEVDIDLWNYKNSEDTGIRDALDFLLDEVLDKNGWSYPQIKPARYDGLLTLLAIAAEKWPDNAYDQKAKEIKQRYPGQYGNQFWNIYKRDWSM